MKITTRKTLPKNYKSYIQKREQKLFANYQKLSSKYRYKTGGVRKNLVRLDLRVQTEANIRSYRSKMIEKVQKYDIEKGRALTELLRPHKYIRGRIHEVDVMRDYQSFNRLKKVHKIIETESKENFDREIQNIVFNHPDMIRLKKKFKYALDTAPDEQTKKIVEDKLSDINTFQEYIEQEDFEYWLLIELMQKGFAERNKFSKKIIVNDTHKEGVNNVLERAKRGKRPKPKKVEKVNKQKNFEKIKGD